MPRQSCFYRGSLLTISEMSGNWLDSVAPGLSRHVPGLKAGAMCAGLPAAYIAGWDSPRAGDQRNLANLLILWAK